MRIVIPLFDRFTALDAVGPYEVLSRLPGSEVIFAAEVARPVRTDGGRMGIVADAALNEIDHCDILVVPGGPGTSEAAQDRSLIDWIRQIHETTSWTASVCTGSELLGAAGLLNGLKSATHWAGVAELESYGATYSGQRVTVEGKIITAAGVSAGIDMALTLAAEAAGPEMAQAIQLGIEYDPSPPFNSGSVGTADPAIVDLVRQVIDARTG
jgi:transcriptional regulator GlxA family with amidase domain